jgi:hypothetical protein
MIPLKERNSLLILQTASFIVFVMVASVTGASSCWKSSFSENLAHFEAVQ